MNEWQLGTYVIVKEVEDSGQLTQQNAGLCSSVKENTSRMSTDNQSKRTQKENTDSSRDALGEVFSGNL